MRLTTWLANYLALTRGRPAQRWDEQRAAPRRLVYQFLDLHAARIIRVPWHVHSTTGAARRLSVGLGHVITRLSVGLRPIAFGLRIVSRKHDLLILHVRASSGRSDMRA